MNIKVKKLLENINKDAGDNGIKVTLEKNNIGVVTRGTDVLEKVKFEKGDNLVEQILLIIDSYKLGDE